MDASFVTSMPCALLAIGMAGRFPGLSFSCSFLPFMVVFLGNKARYSQSQDTTDWEMLGVDPELSTFDRYDA